MSQIVLFINNELVPSTLTYIFDSIKSNQTIRVVFRTIKYRITASSDTNGKILPTGDSLVIFGSRPTYYFTPKVGYELDSLIVNGFKYSNVDSFSFDSVTSNQTIRVTFKIKRYTVRAISFGNGSVTPSNDSVVNYGDTIRYTFTPAYGYELDSFVVNGFKQTDTLVYKLDSVKENKLIQVWFKPLRFTITVSSGANGTIIPTGDTVVNFGTRPIYNITPNFGYELDSLFINNLPVTKTLTYIFDSIKSNQSIRVVFRTIKYRISASSDTNGKIFPIGDSLVIFGSRPTYYFIPKVGYEIDSLIVNDIRLANLDSFMFDSVKSNQSIRVTFKIRRYIVRAISTGNGTITPSNDSVVNYGDTIRYTFTPAYGYELDSFVVIGDQQKDTNIYVDTNIFKLDSIKENKVIQIWFKLRRYMITASSGANGTIIPVGDTIVNFGTRPIYNITPNFGYELDSLFINNVKTANTLNYVFDSIKSNQSIRVVFRTIKYRISASSDTNGKIQPADDSLVIFGSRPIYYFTPKIGYELDSLIVNGIRLTNVDSFKFDSVKSNQTIRVTFKIKRYTVRAISFGNGSVTPSNDSVVNYGDTIRYTFTPAYGYELDSFVVNGVKQTNTLVYKLDSVKENTTVQVWFKIKTYVVQTIANTNGTITPSKDSIVNFGSRPAYIFSPNLGYAVDSIFVNDIYKSNSNFYILDSVFENKVIRVVFKLSQYTILSSSGLNGTISPLGVLGVNFGNRPIYIITPNTGYELDSLIVNGFKYSNIDTFKFDSVKSNQTIRVTFKIKRYTVRAISFGNGSVTPSNDSVVNYGDTIRYSFTPAYGYELDSFVVNGVKQKDTLVYKLDSIKENKTIQVWFKLRRYTITASSGLNGTIIPVGDTIVNFGSRPIYNITPNFGYELDSLFINDLPITNTLNYIFDSIKSNQSIRVVFRSIKYRITANSDTNGKILPVGDSLVIFGSRPIYYFTPKIGYELDSLIVNGIRLANVDSFRFDSVKSNQSIRVTFKIRRYIVRAISTGNGTITPSNDSVVNYGDTIRYTFTSAYGYELDSFVVIGDQQKDTNIYVDTNIFKLDSIKENKVIQIWFKLRRYMITASSGANGTIYPVGDTIVNFGSRPIYNIIPNFGYELDSLFINNTLKTNTLSYIFDSIKSNQSIRVVFRTIKYRISASSDTNGKILPVGDSLVIFGSRPTYYFIPKVGYEIDSLIVNSIKISNVDSFKFDSVKSNQTIRVTFKIKRYTVHAISFGNGSVTPSNDSVVNYGDTIRYIFTPAYGYELDSFVVNGVRQTDTLVYKLDSVKENKIIQVWFKSLRYTITASSGTNGTIIPVGDTIVNFGTRPIYNITPNFGYELDSLFINDTLKANTLSYVFDSIKSNQSIRVVFRTIKYRISASSDTNGKILPVSDSLVIFGSRPTYYFTPKIGYELDSLIVNGFKYSNVDSFSFDSVTSNQTIRVTFKIKRYTVRAISFGNGSVTPSNDSVVNYGDTIRYISIPAYGYELDSFVVNGIRQMDTLVYKFDSVKENKIIQVWFKLRKYTITASSGANGTIIPTGDTVVNFGTRPIYNITPNFGYELDSLFINNLPVTKTLTYIFDSIKTNQSIRVVFRTIKYRISASSDTNGKIFPIGDSLVIFGSRPTYYFIPKVGYEIDSLIVNDIRLANVDSFMFDSVKSNQTIRVTFKIKRYTVRAISFGNGSVTPSNDSVVNYGDTLRYIFTPAYGYELDSFVVNGVKQTDTLVYKLDSVKENKIIQVWFKPLRYTIIASSGANGTIKPVGDTIVNFGARPIYNITPNFGYELDSLFINNIQITNTLSYIFDSIKSNQSIRVVFRTIKYRISASSDTNGKILPVGDSLVIFGSRPTYYFMPKVGYEIDSLIVNGIKISNVDTFKFDSVKSNQTIRVTFRIKRYTVRAISYGNGLVSPSNDSVVNYGDTIRYTFTPAYGYELDSFVVIGDQQKDTNIYVDTNIFKLDSIKENKVIQIWFKLRRYMITASSGANGTIYPVGDTIVNFGSRPIYNIIPNFGYELDSLFINDTLKANTLSYVFDSIKSNQSIRVVFRTIKYRITASSDTNGKILPAGDSLVIFGSRPTYYFTSKIGYELDSLFVNGIKISKVDSFKFDSVKSNQTIRVTFKIKRYTVRAISFGNGSVTPSNDSVVNYGDTIRYIFTPAYGYELDSFVVNSVKQTETLVYKLDLVKENKVIQVWFKPLRYTITASSGTNGTIIPVGDTIVNFGTRPIYNITPIFGYELDSLFINNELVPSTLTYIFDSIKSNQTIRVVFRTIKYRITASSDTNGKILPTGDSLVIFGSRPIYYFTPKIGYEIDSLIVNGIKISNVDSFKFDSVKSNQTIRVTFKIKRYTVRAIWFGNGSVSPNNDSVVNYGDTIRYIFTPYYGYELDSFVVNGVIQKDTLVYKLDSIKENKVIQIWFKLRRYMITASSGANGTIKPVGDTIVNFGTRPIYNITPNFGYESDSLFINNELVPSTLTYIFDSIKSNQTIRVVFRTIKYRITASSDTNGKILSTGDSLVIFGSRPTYYFTPKVGYELDSLIVNGFKYSNVDSFSFDSVTSNQTIRVTFKIKRYTVRAISFGNGSVTPSNDSVVNYGDTLRYIFTPAYGYELDSFVVNGVKQTDTLVYKLDSVKENKIIQVWFKPLRYTIIASSGANGTIKPVGDTIVNFGARPIYNITPNFGYELDSLFINKIQITNTLSYIFDSIKSNQSIRVVFRTIKYRISASSDTNGKILPVGDSLVIFGSRPIYYFTPKIGYELDSLIVNDIRLANVDSFMFDSVTSNQTIRVTFKIKRYTVRAISFGNGSVTPSNDSVVNYGDTIRYIFTPAYGYELDSFVVNGVNQTDTLVYKLDSVKENKLIQIWFKPLRFTITISSGANGTIIPTGDTVVNFGTRPIYNITPNFGYELDSLFINNLPVTKTLTYIFDSIKSNQSIRVVFRTIKYRISASSDTNGKIFPIGDSLVIFGSRPTYYFIPKVGYEIDSLIVNDIRLANVDSFMFDSVKSNQSIRVTFKIRRYIVRAISTGNGTITPSNDSVVNYGDTIRYTFTSAYGYELDSFVVNGIRQMDTLVYKLDLVKENKVIQVWFKIKTYVVQTIANTNGTITPSKDSIVNFGSRPAYIFSPNLGYAVDSIFVNDIYKSNSNFYILDSVFENKVIRVVFKLSQYTILSSSGLNGKITPIGILGVGFGDRPTYVITPNTGYEIDSLIVNGIRLSNVDTFKFDSVKSNQSIRVTFKIRRYIVRAISAVNGTITPSNDSVVNYGDTIRYIFTPAYGYELDSFVVNGVIQIDTLVYKLDSVKENKLIQVWFKSLRYTITASSGTNGTIIPVGDTIVNFGTRPIYNITPNFGYELDSLFINNIQITNTLSYIFDSIKSNQSIRVVFRTIKYRISASSDTNGKILPVGDSLVIFGSRPTYYFMPKVGYEIDSLIVNGIKISNVDTFKFDSVKSNQTIRVTFKIKRYTVRAISFGNGLVTPSNDSVVNYGDTIRYIFTPTYGYELDSFVVNGVKQNDTLVYKLDSVKENKVIQVWFKIKTFIIQTVANPYGTITPAKDSVVNFGSRPAYIFSPNLGYVIDSIFVNDIYKSNSNFYILDSVFENKVIRVVFKLIQYTILSSSCLNGKITPIDILGVGFGDRPTYVITPNTGYEIDSLIVNGIRLSNVDTFKFDSVKSNQSIRVTFKIRRYIVRAISTGNGTITPSNDSVVNYGDTIRYIFTPAYGYELDSFVVNGVKQTNTLVYKLDSVKENKIIQVWFKSLRYTITASSGTNGTIIPVGDTIVNFGTRPIYNITPNFGYELDSLFINDTLKANTLSYVFDSIKSNQSIRVVFRTIKYRISASSDTNGKILPVSDSLVIFGSRPTYYFTPKIGYEIDSLIVNGIRLSNVDSFRFDSVKSNQTIRVTFKIKRYTVRSISFGNGLVTPNNDSVVNYGDTIRYIFTPAYGYELDSFVVNGVIQSDTLVYKLDSIKENKIIQVWFKPLRYTITASSGANGTIKPVGDTIVNFGTRPIYNITPNFGYESDSLFINNELVPSTLTYIFDSIKSNQTIRVVFRTIKYRITASSDTNGKILPTGDSLVIFGSRPTYYFTPKVGYELDSLIVNGFKYSNVDSFSFDSVTSNQTIRVTFKIKRYTVRAISFGNGSVTPSNDSVVNYGDTLRYIFTPAYGYELDSFVVNGVKQTDTLVYKLDSVKENKIIQVWFKPLRYTIIASSGANGTIKPVGDTIVNFGARPIYNITPNFGYELDSLFINNIQITNTLSYIFDSIKSNQSIRVVFRTIKYRITASSDTNGKILPAGDSLVIFGSRPTYYFTSKIGYELDSLFVNGIKISKVDSFKFDSVKSNQTIRVTFKIKRYTVRAISFGNGSVTPSNDSVVNYGDTIRYIFTPGLWL